MTSDVEIRNLTKAVQYLTRTMDALPDKLNPQGKTITVERLNEILLLRLSDAKARWNEASAAGTSRMGHYDTQIMVYEELIDLINRGLEQV